MLHLGASREAETLARLKQFQERLSLVRQSEPAESKDEEGDDVELTSNGW